MLKTILILILFALIISAITFLKNFLKRRPNSYPYQKQPTLFTPSERSFLTLLENSIGNQYRIMGKVRLADLIKVNPHTSPSQAQRAFNRISSKHVDFVACDAVSLTPCFIIELDDSTHNLPRTQKRDDLVNRALEAAGIPIFHFPTNKKYTTADILHTLQNTFPVDKTPKPSYNSALG